MTRTSLAIGLLVAQLAFARPPAQREAEVRAVSQVSVDGGVAGRSVRVLVKVVPNRSQTPSVNIVGTAGEQWLPTLWRAAFVAAEATDSSLLDFEFSLRVDEAIDGPSAGLLTASTLIALLRGKQPLANTSMTGALNPDGSVGPVDDVLLRLREAATAGVKRFGFPSGSRQQLDGAGAMIDLLTEGQRLGVTVKELGSLDDAYLFLTGEALPRPAPAKEPDMELWPAELAAVAKSSAQVKQQFETERELYEKSLTPAAASSVQQRLDRVAKQATDFEQSGDSVRALVVWSAALSMVRVGAELRVLDAKDAGTVLAAVQRLEGSLDTERAEFRSDINVRFPHTTRANDLYAMDLLESIAPEGAEPAPGARSKQLSALSPSDPTFAQLLDLGHLSEQRVVAVLGAHRQQLELTVGLPHVEALGHQPQRVLQVGRVLLYLSQHLHVEAAHARGHQRLDPRPRRSFCQHVGPRTHEVTDEAEATRALFTVLIDVDLSQRALEHEACDGHLVTDLEQRVAFGERDDSGRALECGAGLRRQARQDGGRGSDEVSRHRLERRTNHGSEWPCSRWFARWYADARRTAV